MASMIFDCFLQLYIPSFLHIINKVNFMITVMMSYCLLTYSITFYPLVHSLEKKIYSKTLLTRSKQLKQSYLVETSLFVIKCFLRGLINGLLINFYTTLIFSLLISDIIFLVILFKRALFQKQIYQKFYNYLFFESYIPGSLLCSQKYFKFCFEGNE